MRRGPAANDDAIVADIARALKPLAPQLRQITTGRRAGHIVEKNPAEVKKDMDKTIRDEIARLRQTAPNFLERAAIRKTRSDAREIVQLIDLLRRHLTAATLSPELKTRLGEHDRLAGSGTEISNMPVPRLLDALTEVRGICQVADENQPQTDEVKRWCALIALRLIRTFSTATPSSGSDETAYCTIASLLHASVTGKDERLRGVCQIVLEPYQPLLRGLTEFTGRKSSKI